jgi:hypothetical protein
MTINNIRRATSYGLSTLLFGALALWLAGCASSQISTALASPSGQLFCAIETEGGGTIVAGLIDAASSAVPGATPIAVLATNAGQTAVNADCAKAGGMPVSPPAMPSAAPLVAIASPASPTTATVKAS